MENGYDRYEVRKMIGSGAYGLVYSAKDLTTNRDVAIKQINTAFECIVDAKRILREIKLLSKWLAKWVISNELKFIIIYNLFNNLEFFGHENIVSLVDNIKPVHEIEYKEVNIITEKMDTDLSRVFICY